MKEKVVLVKKCIECKRPMRKNRGGGICDTCVSKSRRQKNKKRMIEYKGGKCSRCGFSGHPAAFEFHHLNPSEKDFSIGDMTGRKWDVVVKEIDKCILLCSNCHRIEHCSY